MCEGVKVGGREGGRRELTLVTIMTVINGNHSSAVVGCGSNRVSDWLRRMVASAGCNY